MPSAAERLISRFESRDATVAVIGLGYVGLPTARAFHDAGFRVVGFDIDENKVESLRRAEPYIHHLGQAMHEELAASERFAPTSDLARLTAADAIVICVPTPLDAERKPDLSYLLRSTEIAAKHVEGPCVLVSQSTSYPGTLRDAIRPVFERFAGERGAETLLAYSPEREDPGRQSHSTRTIPRLVGGIDAESTRVAAALYRQAVDTVVEVESAEVAEAAKLLENTYRAVNIALVNETKVILDAMGIDVWRVIDAAATKPFGFQRFEPGPGFGGHCIPVDPFYLAHRASELGVAADFIALAGEVNVRMPKFVIEKLETALADRGTRLEDASVLLVGLAYKPNIDDDRESPAAELLALLSARGVHVAYHDPHIPRFAPMRKHRFELESTPLTKAALAEFDAAVIVTRHDAVDYSELGKRIPLIIDTRNAMAAIPECSATVVRA